MAAEGVVMADFFTVGTASYAASTPPQVELRDGATAVVTNINGGTLYYKSTYDVSTGSSDGSLTAGQSATLTANAWLIGSAATQVSVDYARALSMAPDISIRRTGTNAITVDEAVTISGASTLSSTLAVTGAHTATGAITPNGGIAQTSTAKQTRWGTFAADSATAGTDTACDNGSIWAASIFIPYSCTLTGIEYLVGSVGGTDNVAVGLYSDQGALLANSALDSSVTVGTAAQLQQVAFTSTYAAVGGKKYIIAVQFNGTTAKFRSIPAYTSQGTLRVKQAGTFGTLAALSPLPTALTADVGPIASTY